MSAEAAGWHVPAIITLDDLAAAISAGTYGCRHGTGPEVAWLLRTAPAGHIGGA